MFYYSAQHPGTFGCDQGAERTFALLAAAVAVQDLGLLGPTLFLPVSEVILSCKDSRLPNSLTQQSLHAHNTAERRRRQMGTMAGLPRDRESNGSDL